MFKVGTFYKHSKNTDVIMEVKGVLFQDWLDASLIVAWWNIKMRPMSKIVGAQVVRIKPEQMNSWETFDVGNKTHK